MRPWRTWFLLILLLGPMLAYMAFGAIWLWQKGWILPVGVAWILSGLLFSVLLARWTKDENEILPPLDWDAPSTFSPLDKKAWDLVQEEAEHGDHMEMSKLNDFDIYIDTGKRMAKQLASHYRPDANDPIDNVAIVELLTALELAADDLTSLCRQVPGGDLITVSHWKTALKAANVVSRANDIYSVILPLFNPLTGLVRLGTRQLIQKPAWRDMQQNLLRWFYRAYVNRLGAHLIELYSGRLVIGADQYRRIARHGMVDKSKAAESWDGRVTIGIAGRKGGKSDSILSALEARRNSLGLASLLDDNALSIERIKKAKLVEIPSYDLFDTDSGEALVDQTTRAEAVAEATEADLIILLVPGVVSAADLAFAREWKKWALEHPTREAPAILVVSLDTDTRDPRWESEFEPLKQELSPSDVDIVATPIAASDQVIIQSVVPAIANLLPHAERTSIIRHLQKASSKSKAKRLLGQVAHHGVRLWKNMAREKTQAKSTGKSHSSKTKEV